eukprot:jgi/Mesen1/6353/ME000328S05628
MLSLASSQISSSQLLGCCSTFFSHAGEVKGDHTIPSRNQVVHRPDFQVRSLLRQRASSCSSFRRLPSCAKFVSAGLFKQAGEPGKNRGRFPLIVKAENGSTTQIVEGTSLPGGDGDDDGDLQVGQNVASNGQGSYSYHSLQEVGSSTSGAGEVGSHNGSAHLDALRIEGNENFSSASEGSPGPGLVSFRLGTGLATFSRGEDSEYGLKDGKLGKKKKKDKKSKKKEVGLRDYLWLLGPFALVASWKFPPIVVRAVVENYFGNTVFTDVLVSFAIDAIFMAALAFYITWVHKHGIHLLTPLGVQPWLPPSEEQVGPPAGYEQWKTVINVVCIGIPVLAVVFSPAYRMGNIALAVLLPYLMVLGCQHLGQAQMHKWQSPAWPLVPVIFQIYRLYQIIRSQNLVLGIISMVQEASPPSVATSWLSAMFALLSVLSLLWMGNLAITLSTLPWLYTRWAGGAGEEAGNSSDGEGPAPPFFASWRAGPRRGAGGAKVDADAGSLSDDEDGAQGFGGVGPAVAA